MKSFRPYETQKKLIGVDIGAGTTDMNKVYIDDIAIWGRKIKWIYDNIG